MMLYAKKMYKNLEKLHFNLKYQIIHHFLNLTSEMVEKGI
ncbi:hypothetical protein SAMN05880501_104180 [Ureibacillus xyleni]|uniref:Uncharacterized protein n=1 Tax=Ureibacillus xyleni TaxID=614648 RepID=A0A285SDX3_9BACL|nr:hypothetical protein SAMN05880501_104180 [Ureibacillus xyleni]